MPETSYLVVWSRCDADLSPSCAGASWSWTACVQPTANRRLLVAVIRCPIRCITITPDTIASIRPPACRSQKDIQEGMPIVDGLTREKAFFERHYAYRAMASRCGTPYLTRMLSHMLFTAIKAHLPSIRSQLSLAAQSYEQQLRELGDPVEAAGPREQGHLLLKVRDMRRASCLTLCETRATYLSR